MNGLFMQFASTKMAFDYLYKGQCVDQTIKQEDNINLSINHLFTTGLVHLSIATAIREVFTISYTEASKHV